MPPIPFHELQFAVDLNFEDAILGGSGSGVVNSHASISHTRSMGIVYLPT